MCTARRVVFGTEVLLHDRLAARGSTIHVARTPDADCDMDELVKEIVLTVHGVGSGIAWQLQITPEFGGIEGFVHHPHHYGRFPFWNVLIAGRRDAQVDAFRRKLESLREKHPNVRPSVVAHSFGTYIVCRALMSEVIELDRLVLCGSIVSRDYDWSAVIGKHVNKVRNEVAGSDRVVRMFRWRVLRLLVPHSGPSGIDSFTAAATNFEQQVFPAHFHSSHFVANDHCRRYWMPFLRGTRDFQAHCSRCLNGGDPGQDRAYTEFMGTYDPAIKTAIRQAFASTRRSERQLTDYLNIVRTDVITYGAQGLRRFDELTDIFTRSLRHHVR
jgi:hypothetical protein